MHLLSARMPEPPQGPFPETPVPPNTKSWTVSDGRTPAGSSDCGVGVPASASLLDREKITLDGGPQVLMSPIKA